jgi:hypothetical protein
VQVRILLRQRAALGPNLIRLASRLSRRLKPDGAYLRGYAVETMRKDQELWNALHDTPGLAPGLFDQVVEAVLHPQSEHP